MFVDRILHMLGENPAYIYPEDKWPNVLAILFIYSLPVIFILLFIGPAIWIFWYKKTPFTLRNIGKALVRGIGFIFLGLIALYFLASYLQGLAFKALNS